MNHLTLFKRSIITVLLLLCVSNQALAAQFSVVGKITRTLSDGRLYGGCMIALNVAMPAPCPANGWVSLDCTGTYYDPAIANNSFTSALTAFSMGRSVQVYVPNDTVKHNNYCVAARIDILSN